MDKKNPKNRNNASNLLKPRKLYYMPAASFLPYIIDLENKLHDCSILLFLIHVSLRKVHVEN